MATQNTLTGTLFAGRYRVTRKLQQLAKEVQT